MAINKNGELMELKNQYQNKVIRNRIMAVCYVCKKALQYPEPEEEVSVTFAD